MDFSRSSLRNDTPVRLHFCKAQVEEIHLECRTVQYVQLCGLGPPPGLNESASEPQGPEAKPKIRHDWKAFSADPGLQARCTEEVRKHYQQLETGAEPSSEYARFMAVNAKATRLCVPLLDKDRTSLRPKHLEVVAARKNVEEACLDFESDPTVERHGALNKAKQLLFSAYDTIKGKELMESVHKVQAA